MKRMMPGLLSATLVLLPAGAALAQVYKTVDENGNVVYTDKAPNADAKPMDLPELSIVEAPSYEQPAKRARAGAANEDGQVTDIGALRRGYRDFRIVSPMPEQNFWGTGNTASIAWDTRFELQQGMQVVVYLDGKAEPPTTSRVMTTPQLDRGEHKVSAELQDADGRTIASAPEVTFYIKQQSALFNRPVPTPHGGG